MRSSYDRGEAPYPYALAIEPHQMDHLLARNLSSHSHIVLRHESDFRDFRVDAAGVRATYERGGEVRQVLARILVGDDGRHSRVRDLARIPGTLTPYKDSYLGASLLLPEDSSSLPPAIRDTSGRYFLAPRSIFFFFSVSERRRFFLTLLPDRDRDKFFANGVEAVLERLDRLVPGFAETAKENGLDNLEKFTELSVWKVDLERWCDDGVVLIGDAAHAMNPHVAQGRNQAMEDARVLAPIIARALLSGPLVRREALLPYERARIPVIRSLHRLADEMTRVWNSGNSLVVRAREAAFRGIGRSPSLQRKIVTTIGGTRILPLTSWDKIRALVAGL
ncbi:MAG: NAD(P)/FAD-dependent oxidoreductase [Nitrospiraceae bacterium]|nr:NAD(P)/FAD-dependent oxidoreductase [Nitrospiraceae bacterium]